MLFDFLLNPPTPLARFESNDGECIVDTCLAGDTREYETGVVHPRYNDGKWVIVEEYDGEKKALIGHAKWVKKMSAKVLPKSLRDVSTSEIAQMAEAFGGEDWREAKKKKAK